MSIIIDVLLLALIVFCCKRGTKREVAATLVSIIVFVIAMTGAGYLSKEYSGGMQTALDPFLSGLMESQGAPKVQEDMGMRKNAISINDKIDEDPTFIFDYSEACLTELGISGKTAEQFSHVAAQKLVNGADASEAVNETFCGAVAYFIGVIIAFALIIIFLSVVVELTHIKPKMNLGEADNEFFGVILGFVKGFVLCIALCWVLSYLGIVIGRHSIEDSILAKFMLSLNYLTSIAVA